MASSCHFGAFICLLLSLCVCCYVQGDIKLNKPKTMEDHVVIISDRSGAVRVTVGSILMNSKRQVTIWIITTTPGDVEMACQNLTRRDDQFITVLDFEWINGDLISIGVNPLWFWPDYGKSITEGKKWLSKQSIRAGTWDYNVMHSHRMNMLRFYLAKIPALASIQRIFFMDDDVILRRDLALVHDLMTLENTVVVGTCSTWTYNKNRCSFSPVLAEQLLKSTALYLSAPRCSQDLRENCVPQNHLANLHFLRHRFRKKLNFNTSIIWNFGFTMIDLERWRRFNLTEEFQWMMGQVYKLRLFPETSLTFGLGVGFLLLADYVQCWEEFNIDIFDGAGYITEWDELMDGKPIIKNQTFAIHWSGNDKPWNTGPFDAGSHLRASFRLPWLETSKALGMQSSITPSQQVVRVVFLTDTDLNSEWFVDLLSKHPQICTSATSGRFSFPRTLLAPPRKRVSQKRTCLADKLCAWETIVNYVPGLAKRYDRVCDAASGTISAKTWILCKWAKKVIMLQAAAREEAVAREVAAEPHSNGSSAAPSAKKESWVEVVDMLKKVYLDVIFGGDLHESNTSSHGPALPCNCPTDRHIRMFLVETEWFLLEAEQNLFYKRPNYSFPWESTKIIRFSKRNLIDRYIKFELRNSSRSVSIDTKKMLSTLSRWGRLQDTQSLIDGKTLTTLTLNSDDCILNAAICLRLAFNFIGVEGNLLSKDVLSDMDETWLMKQITRGDLWRSVENKAEVQDALIRNGFEDYLQND